MDVSDFRSVYEREGRYNLKVQVPYLSKLADHYAAIGAEDPVQNWRSILQAHSLYNSCAARVSLRQPNHEQDQMSEPLTTKEYQDKAFEIHNVYCGAAGLPAVNNHKLREVQLSHCESLIKIRQACKKKTDDLIREAEQYLVQPEELDSAFNHHVEDTISHQMKELSIKCTSDVIKLIDEIISASITFMGTSPPCDFAAIALGSLARQEATPYSDLEFLFIIADKNESTEEYFQHLAMTVYFVIGNLQETNLKYMDIEELEGWFEDESKSGLKIDGIRTNAGNIPTGNGETDEKNKYICTVLGLLNRYELILNSPEFQTNINHRSGVTGDDSDMLAYVRLIKTVGEHGRELFYRLVKGLTEIKPNKDRIRQRVVTLEKDINNYDIPYFSARLRQSLHVKSEIYRFPSLLLQNMKMIKGLNSESSWDTMAQLAARDLQTALSVPLLIRLSCYLHHDSQCEQMSIHKAIHQQLSKYWNLPHKLFLINCISLDTVKVQLNLESITWPQMFFTEKLTQYQRIISAAKVQFTVYSCDDYMFGEYVKHIPQDLYPDLPYDIALFALVAFTNSCQYDDALPLVARLMTTNNEFRLDTLGPMLWEVTLHHDSGRKVNKKLETRIAKLIKNRCLPLETIEYLIFSIYSINEKGSYTIPFDIDELIHPLLPEKQFQRAKAYYYMLKQDFKQALLHMIDFRCQLETSEEDVFTLHYLQDTVTHIGQLQFHLGQHSQSINSIKQGLVLSYRVYPNEVASYGHAALYIKLGISYKKLADNDWAEKAFNKAFNILKRRGDAKSKKMYNVLKSPYELYCYSKNAKQCLNIMHLLDLAHDLLKFCDVNGHILLSSFVYLPLAISMHA